MVEPSYPDAAPPPSTPLPPSQPPGSRQPETLLSLLQGLWRELPGLLSDRVELLSLELKRAGLALAQIVALIVVSAILGVTAWLAVWAAAVMGLIALGLHWSLSLLLVLAVNALAVWLAISRVRRLVTLLRLPATRRHLMLSPSPTPKPGVTAPTKDREPPPTGAGQPAVP